MASGPLAYDKPTPAQQEAIALLPNDHNPDEISACVKYARSVDGNHSVDEGVRGNGKEFTVEEVNAIKTLTGRADERLSLWLREAQPFGGPETLKQSQAYTLSSTRRKPACGHSKDNRCCSEHHPSSASKLPPADVVNEPHRYHCTICDVKRSYQHASDWKKHEKEHEYEYRCMPEGGQAIVGQSYQCVFCKAEDPDDLHALQHGAQSCHFSCKRRQGMVKHLGEHHGVSSIDTGRSLAALWIRGSGRQAWSCGFCISLFHEFHDRLKHIDIEHFRKRQKIEYWDGTNVIQGLLLQDGLSEAFKREVISRYGFEPRKISWQSSPPAVKDVQYRLEMGPSEKESAISLARAALDCCEISGAQNWDRTSNFTNDDQVSLPMNIDTLGDYDQSIAAYDPFTASNWESTLWEASHAQIESQSSEGLGHGQMPIAPGSIFDDFATDF